MINIEASYNIKRGKDIVESGLIEDREIQHQIKRKSSFYVIETGTDLGEPYTRVVIEFNTKKEAKRYIETHCK